MNIDKRSVKIELFLTFQCFRKEWSWKIHAILRVCFSLDRVLFLGRGLRFSFASSLRWFPSFALRIPTRTIFASLARAIERVHVQNVRDLPQTKLDNEINARFLLNDHGDPHFLFYKFKENNNSITEKKYWQKSVATFFRKWKKCYKKRRNGSNRASPNCFSFKG